MNSPRFVWDDNYSVEVAEIDEQHKHYFEITNSIYDLLSESPISADGLTVKITELGNYAFYHLSTEEKYFKQFNYEDAESHIQEHNDFRQKITDYINQARNPDTETENLANEVASFAKDWLSRHIPQFDKKYIKCFHEHDLR
ncbi:hypothetical protein A3G50_00525 [Candidatus Jorgensenbacteria bacterium RIFCSPLOWO2_12_FULL_42_11]|uniref:Hemerythrin-like domain-containing protein n=1 Tax=Candidatus Jorgensenbacteria bacterium RIFCSPLOWO2_12_FULL_42_11 TaxID=1798473 RepID=A0A1F6C0W7_9BACT|nr:MAG: hypothetical protein A3G50_00525 [Candidatus Jorgensenbacteria bacterium RIFCSPLOWO2_12_FULL_42_11]